MADRPSLPVGTLLGGKYRVVRLVGTGSMGAVYEATGRRGDRIAVKTLVNLPLGVQRVELIERFARESIIASRLASLHVAPAIDAGFDDLTGVPYIVMRFVSGMDLETLVGEAGALHPTVAVRIVHQACRGLLAAHEAGIVHRDVKPSNLLLGQDDAGRVTVALCDFGIAKLLETSATITGAGKLMGTPLYMAPEQALGAADAGVAADVWSIGMCLYDALGGGPAFRDAKTLADALIALKSAPVDHLQDRSPWVDAGLAVVVHGALLRDRDARCPSVRAFMDALWPYCGGSDELAADVLGPVPADVAAHRAPRAELPKAWAAAEPSVPPPPPSTDAPVSSVRTEEPGAPRAIARARTAALPAAFALVVFAVVLVAFLLLR